MELARSVPLPYGTLRERGSKLRVASRREGFSPHNWTKVLTTNLELLTPLYLPAIAAFTDLANWQRNHLKSILSLGCRVERSRLC
ncbi:hypothetical protein [Nostoc commune]|uniref:hypothetical protein n=1 Tax=Nostoc commune TaxID=1178 RepID=UPI0018C84C14|nr:hypothetical protein [Nostoc commune]MBG1263196.1 hypothetical protein [Nostoc commune BAE]